MFDKSFNKVADIFSLLKNPFSNGERYAVIASLSCGVELEEEIRRW